MTDTSGPTGVRELIEEAHKLLVALGGVALESYLREWPDRARLRTVVPATLPVLRWLVHAEADSSGMTCGLVRQIVRLGPVLSWRQTYKTPAVEGSFLERYGWTEMIGLSGPAASEQIACGFLLLGPQTRYPRHRHEAEEIYIPLAGRADWQQGNSPWEERIPGALIHHSSDEPHAMQTRAQPLLALYLWRGNLDRPSRLDPPTGT